MRYNELGNTGLKVSELGLGCEGFVKGDAEAERLLCEAVDGGINFMDLYSPDPAMRDFLGRVMRKLPEPLLLQGHLCAVWEDGQYKRTREIGAVRQGFEDLLARLGVDRIDIGMIHYVDKASDWERVANGPVMEYALEEKRRGRIGHIGLSSHNPAAAMLAVESGLIDVLMFSVNPCYDLQPPTDDVEELWAEKNYEQNLVNIHPDRENLYLACQDRGVGLTVMKAFGGGDLLSAQDSPAGVALTAAQCISYALARPGAASVMAGVRNEEDLRSLLAYETASSEEKDYAAAFASFPRISWNGHCMYCGHCAPCPEKIDVAMVMKLYSLAKGRDEIPETVREHYAALDAKAGDCIECGACEARCPFGVAVREEMKKTEELFGS